MKKILDIILQNLTIPIGVLSVLFCFVLQQTPGLFEIGGVKPIPLVPAVLALSATSRAPTFSALVGLVAGFAWEIAAGRIVGYFALFLMISAAFVAVYWQRDGLSAVNFILHSTLAVAIICLSDLLVSEYLMGYSSVTATFSLHTLPTVLYTGFVSPIIYLLCNLPNYLHERSLYVQEEEYEE